ncbi:MAG TPA: SsrA-binding protein SmpB [Dehalococcoidia bacterium]|jgi:SsrA-binding protein|nr:SsrA-binding protein [Chloroflexota bacterium]MDP6056144.1 SsrA-binding protein SmpB [Dehalococcoidia bacterium]MDP7090078.1 SsrA-binding protein SmpB [Dehalococcoidia bacterium]MDP7261571.1 SsrA-binding protein SmpB [Dehalococcoidia bacterium]MDP7485015.1 SsrA-binding protein SmpB [Dehalococcoidia bacterium]|tara:strand:+ start:3087 stop:3554 length:468 start_codon:yes stop_codon:yes gene_type:complete
MADNDTQRALATNRRARYDYFINETFEAGLVLLGSEIKSAREGRMNIAEGYVYLKNGEAWLENAHIPQYAPAGEHGQHDPARPRKLLLRKKQLSHLDDQAHRNGQTIVPLKVYIKNRVAKLLVGVGKGKRQVDRRNTIKERDAKREIDRAMRSKV